MDDLLHCLACAAAIADDQPSYPDVSGTLCANCAPTYRMLLVENDAASFVDLDTGEPQTSAARRAIYDAHIAGGGNPDDSMATRWEFGCEGCET